MLPPPHHSPLLPRLAHLLGATFLPWYLWSLLYYPQPLLWASAASLALLFVLLALRWPRSPLLWLPPAIMLFNHLHFWLPWPSLKLAYLAPAALCFATALRSLRARHVEPLHLNVWFASWLLCMASSACMAVLRQWYAQDPAAWHEFAHHLRRLPFLDEWNLYVSLRYVWVWALALATYFALTSLVRRPRDVRVVLWSIVLTSLPAALFGIYSYFTRTFMVSHYAVERRISGTFSTPAVLADMLTIACIAAAYLLSSTRRLLLRLLLLLTIVLAILAILYSGCRINLFLLITLSVLTSVTLLVRRSFWLRRNWWLPASATALTIALLAVAGWLTFPKWRPRLERVPAIARTKHMIAQWQRTPGPWWYRVRALLPGRVGHWEVAINMLRRHPFWGIGAGAFERKYAAYRARDDLFVFARAHNVFLRIAAESGLVTFITFLAVVLSVLAAFRTYRGNGLPTDLAWLRLRPLFFVVVSALLITSLFSDIWLENTESVVMLAVLATLASATYRPLAPLPPSPEETEWLIQTSWWHRLRATIYAHLLLLTWGAFGIASVRRTLLLLSTILFCVLGLRRAFYDGHKTMLRGEAAHGFIPASHLVTEPGDWFAFGRCAVRSVIVASDVMRLTLLPLNERMARELPRVSVFINNVKVGTLSLHPRAVKTLYCDVSRLRHDVAVVRLVAQRTFSPWHLGWYADPFAYGGISSSLEWVHQDPFYAFTSLEGLWNAYWTSYVKTYFALGHTNYEATVRVPFIVPPSP